MNLSDIQDLIKFVSKSGVNEVEIEKKEFKIVIKSGGKSKKDDQPIIVQQAAPQMVQASAPVAAAPVTPAPAAPAPAAAPAAEESNLITVKSPMIGTFYRSSFPEKDAIVQVGVTISVGSPVCIIEAMKLFNEIESEVSGKVVKVLVDDATPVEYDQPLFMVEPA